MRLKLLWLIYAPALCAAGFAAHHPVWADDLIAKSAASASPENDWTGPYLGIGIGARLSGSVWTTDCLAPIALPETCPNDTFSGTRIDNDNPAASDGDAPRLGGYVGMNWQISNLVLGLEGEAAWARDRRTHSGIPGTWSTEYGSDFDTARIESAWDASLRARGGILLTPRALIYSTGGLALIDLEVGATCDGTFPVGWCVAPNADSDTAVAAGWTAGGGIEWMLTKEWILRGEYRYSDYGHTSVSLFDDTPLDSLAVTIEHKASLAYFGISRRF